MNRTILNARPLAVAPLFALLLLAAPAPAQTAQPQASPGPTPLAPARAYVAGTPSAAVHAFYKALGERRFREAFAMSVFRPAVEGLSQEEFEELRPDFERMATGVPAEIVLTGEQVSGEEATVFLKLGEGDKVKVEPVFLLREGGAWIVATGEGREGQKAIKKSGRKFFFEARIEAHHQEVEQMLQRIKLAQGIFASQNNGRFGDLAALVRAGFVPQDILGSDTTGYRFAVSTAADGKKFTATAEPARYGRTGKLSFYVDETAPAVQKKDTGGKPFRPEQKKG